jgi:hypothetical protein
MSGIIAAVNRTAGTLRTITKYLTQASSKLEPVDVLLECGHVTQSSPTYKRARCLKCRGLARLSAVKGRLRMLRQRRRSQDDATPIFVAVEDRRHIVRLQEGYRVIELVARDVTPVDRRRKCSFEAFERIRIACHADAVSYVRAKVLELQAELDGIVLKT